jgi:hypothetical protein
MRDHASVRAVSPAFARIRPSLPVIAGAVTLLSVGVLLLDDACPQWFPPDIHDALATLPLVLIAFACLLLQLVRRAPPGEWAKALIVAMAFLFWAANQIWPDRTLRVLFNDVAIGLFVVDAFLVIIGWPANSVPDAAAQGLSVSARIVGPAPNEWE